MCGRYNLVTDPMAWIIALGLLKNIFDNRGEPFKPDYNIAPSPVNASSEKFRFAPIVLRNESSFELTRAVWPLIPKWAKGQVSKYSTANARAETMSSAASYKSAWINAQRCIIPVSGFYEWQVVGEGKPKQPYNIQVVDEPIFGLAGLWEVSVCGDQTVTSFTIITTAANPLMEKIHNTKKRMPVILPSSEILTWLTGDAQDALACIKSFPEKLMRGYTISTAVNNPNFNDEKCTLSEKE